MANSPSGVEPVMRPDRLFCDLSAEALEALEAIKLVSSFPQGTKLFREGYPARGIFVVCEGRARLSVCSESGKNLVVRVAGPGEVLGLSAALSGGRYEMTAEVVEQARIALVKRKDLLCFLSEYREACMQVVQLLSEDLHSAYDRMRSIELGRTRHPRTARAQ